MAKIERKNYIFKDKSTTGLEIPWIYIFLADAGISNILHKLVSPTGFCTCRSVVFETTDRAATCLVADIPVHFAVITAQGPVPYV